MNMKQIYDFDYEGLKEVIINHNESKYRVDQLWNLLYRIGINDIEQINSSNLNKSLKDFISLNLNIERLKIINNVKSNEDQSEKIVIQLEDNYKIESVLIKEKDYHTLCVSTQVGCNMKCSFCRTGTLKFKRNLSAGEIVQQYLIAKDLLHDWPIKDDTKKEVNNIVFMGMGEPLLNYENVKKSIYIFTNNNGLNVSKHNITISTCGIVPIIYKCADELSVNLAISLHSTNNEIRSKLMPINDKYSIKDILKAGEYYSKTTGKQITLEYILIDKINDTDQEAIKLVNIIKSINAKINIIPFNSWNGCEYQTPSKLSIEKFTTILYNHDIIPLIRYSKGNDIMAACGQLV